MPSSTRGHHNVALANQLLQRVLGFRLTVADPHTGNHLGTQHAHVRRQLRTERITHEPGLRQAGGDDLGAGQQQPHPWPSTHRQRVMPRHRRERHLSGSEHLPGTGDQVPGEGFAASAADVSAGFQIALWHPWR